MRILVFSWRDPKHPLAGGAEQVMHQHMRGWTGAGHRVTLFSSKIPGLKSTEFIEGIKIVRRGNQYLGVQIAAFIFYLREKNNFDLIIDQFHGLPFFTPLYSRKPKIAVIQETARKVWFLNPFPPPVNLLIGIIGFIAEPFFFLFYKKTYFATGSESAKIDVSKMGIPLQNITVWPHGVIIPKLQSNKQKEKRKTICFLGVLSKDKGVLDAIKCFSVLSKKDEGYQFWIIGKPETEQFGLMIKKLIKKLQLEKKIKLWGFVSQNKKFELLRRSHVLINPSAREGWGLVNIEANAMGVPVVSYKAAGLVDSVKNNYSGLFCRENTYVEMANLVDRLLRNNSKYLKLCKTAILWSKKFNWENSVKISINSINKVAGVLSYSKPDDKKI